MAIVKVQIDFSKCKLPPYEHQKQGVIELIKKSNLALFDEMGVGKTKQIIDAQQFLFEAGIIDTVLVLAPASVRGVWDGTEFGEIKKHSWGPYITYRFDAKSTFPVQTTPGELNWIIASYDYIKQQEVLTNLLYRLRGRKFTLVLDESALIKSYKAQRTKAVGKLTKLASRRVLANGTPIANNLLDLWSQMYILDPASVNHKNFYQFRARWFRMGGYLGKQVIGHSDDIQILLDQLKPWILRREKADVLKYLPPKTFSHIECAMSKEAWRLYTEMRDDMVAWLDQATPATASQAAVRVARLSQITSGFLGGIEGQDPQPIDDAKLKAFLEWRDLVPGQVVSWCRFRAEIFRLAEAIRASGRKVGVIIGGQSDKERQAVVDGFQRGEITDVVGQPLAGGLGLTLTRSSTVAYLSNDYSLTGRLQSEDRVHRPGQESDNVNYVDFVAVSPEGRRTIDHGVLRALREKKELAGWGTKDWKTAILGDA